MKKISVKLKQNPYDIYIGQGILSQLGLYVKKLAVGKDAIIITNAKINRLYGKTICLSLKRHGFTSKVLTVADGEASKSATVAFQLMAAIARYDIFKQPFIIALGGGVIGDLAGYVASAYKRGIPYVQVPTSFLAQIDSAIGGKVAVDLPVGKNLVGAFYQPRMVFSDVKVLKSLPTRQIKNGMAEVIKYGVIYDKRFFNHIVKNCKDIMNKKLIALEYIVRRCSQIKTEVVLKDEKETKNIRTILNFGHTVGHAIEAAGEFKLYQHGEAVGLGMRIAANLSVQHRYLTTEDESKLNEIISKVGLPKCIKKLKVPRILLMMRHDKKFVAGKNRFVLARGIGQVKVVDGVKESKIISAIKKYIA